MLKIIETALQTLFPPRNTETLVDDLRANNKIPSVRPNMHHSITYLSSYENTAVHALVVENKYHRNKTASKIMANMFTAWLETQPGTKIVIPIPLGKRRMKTRGYNQVENFLNLLPASDSYQVNKKLLKRIKETAPQTSLEKTERLENVIGAFECPNPELLHNYSGSTLIIVDDVTTTGATLQAAKAAIEPLVPKSTRVTCVAIAH